MDRWLLQALEKVRPCEPQLPEQWEKKYLLDASVHQHWHGSRGRALGGPGLALPLEFTQPSQECTC